MEKFAIIALKVFVALLILINLPRMIAIILGILIMGFAFLGFLVVKAWIFLMSLFFITF